jgi:hypothetical protein
MKVTAELRDLIGIDPREGFGGAEDGPRPAQFLLEEMKRLAEQRQSPYREPERPARRWHLRRRHAA